METTTKPEKPCKKYLKDACKDGRDHCFNCARHLDPVTQSCPMKCGEGGDEDVANNCEDD